jgi:hypothetical protein
MSSSGLTYGLEGGHLILAAGDVVDDEATLGSRGVLVIEELPASFVSTPVAPNLISTAFHIPVGNLRNTLVASVPGLEVQIRRPVVRQVIRITARRARSQIGDVSLRHRGVERVASHNLMHVRRRGLARVDQRVDPINHDL